MQSELLSETRPGYAASYTYDHNGNRLTRTLNGQTETYIYDGADTLLEITGGADPRAFDYDTQGRTTLINRAGTANDQAFSYDHESRVKTVTRGSDTVSYAYNGLDTRTSVTSGSNTNNFLRDGAYVTDPVLVDSGATYTPGISERRGTTTTYLHSGLKNAFAQSGTSQNVTATREYDAFGNVTSPSGSWAGPFGYAGKFGYQSPSIPGTTTPDEGITLMGHRYYDSSTGRFLTRDPIFDGRNWYSYGGGQGNPLTQADPTGLKRFGPFKSILDAVNHAAKNPDVKWSMEIGIEVGGWIVKNKDGTYSYTLQWADHTGNTLHLGPPPLNAVGTWHTHPLLQGEKHPFASYYNPQSPDLPSPADKVAFRDTPGKDYILSGSGGVFEYDYPRIGPPAPPKRVGDTFKRRRTR